MGCWETDESELFALLGALPEGGQLSGDGLKRFNSLVNRTGLAQAEEALKAAKTPELIEFEGKQVASFRQMVARETQPAWGGQSSS